MAIRAYAAGAPMPEVELALSQRFKAGYDPETGLRVSAYMPTGWQAAIAAREKMGVAAHRPYQSAAEGQGQPFEFNRDILLMEPTPLIQSGDPRVPEQ